MGYGARGYWGYLLSLHEMINDWTGQVTGGWPTDFWADHVSAFPNSLDWHIMESLGTKNHDQNPGVMPPADAKSGCSVGAGPARLTWALFGLALFGLLVRRRALR